MEKELKRSGADHRQVPLLMTAPGIGWVTGFTIAIEIGDIGRFSSPTKLTGCTGLCPSVSRSGEAIIAARSESSHDGHDRRVQPPRMRY